MQEEGAIVGRGVIPKKNETSSGVAGPAIANEVSAGRRRLVIEGDASGIDGPSVARLVNEGGIAGAGGVEESHSGISTHITALAGENGVFPGGRFSKKKQIARRVAGDCKVLRRSRIIDDACTADRQPLIRTPGRASNRKGIGPGRENHALHFRLRKAHIGQIGGLKGGDIVAPVRNRRRRPIGGGIPVAVQRIKSPSGAASADGRKSETRAKEAAGEPENMKRCHTPCYLSGLRL